MIVNRCHTPMGVRQEVGVLFLTLSVVDLLDLFGFFRTFGAKVKLRAGHPRAALAL
jgi:hypothetical protein